MKADEAGHAARKGRGCPSLRGPGRRRRVVLHKNSTEWPKKKKKEEALVLWRFRKGFFVRLPLLFSVWFLSLSLPPNLSLPHSAEGSASSKDTLVDSRKSGCCRSAKNLVGVSVWVEPVEEQRWLHHSSLGTWHTPSPTRSKKKKTRGF